MRFFTLAALSGLALLVSAQTSQRDAANVTELIGELAKLPTCVTTCITKSLPQTRCALTDFACLCSDKAYADFSQQCILSSCTIRQALLAQGWQYKACPVPEHDAGPLTARLAYFFLALGAVCVGCRFLARWRIHNSTVGIDDWSILVSYILMIPAAILIIMMAKNGMGKDIWRVPAEDITMMLKVFYIDQFFYQVVVVLTKISIVLLYLRIFPKEISRRFTYVSYVVIAGLLAYLTAFIVVFLTECQPISYFWTQWDGEHEGHCANVQLAAYINGGINIFFDLVVFFLPMPKLLKLQVQDTRRKVGVIMTFLVGLLVTACSVIRLTYLADVGKYANATYHYNNVGLWTGLEAYLGIVCACMPSILGPLLRLFRDTIGSKLSSGSKSGSRSQISSIGNKGAVRLHSGSVEHSRSEEIELAKHAQKRGEAEKTRVKSMYDLEYDHEDTSRESVKLVFQNFSPRESREPHGGV